MSNVHVCLQVRTSSKRMPFKCFLPIRKIESIKVLIRRIKSKKYSVNILSSNDPSDDYLIKKLKDENCKIYRGDLNNVYKRFANFSKNLKDEEIIVRLTADNIFIDHNLIDEIVKYFKKNNYDYAAIDRKKSKLPYGISIEVFNLKTFRKWKAISAYEKEHVTPRILKLEKNIGLFHKKNKENFYNLSCTMDTILDYHKIYLCFEKSKNIKTNCMDLCGILKNIKRSEIGNLNKKYSRIVIGSAQFAGKYSLSKISTFTKIQIEKLLNEAFSVGIYKIDTATTYNNVHSLLQKIPVISKFEIISKEKILYEKISKFEKSFFTVNKFFGVRNLKYFLIHNPEKFLLNKNKIIKITNKNKQLFNKLGISLYNPNEIKKEDLNYFKNIQIPFNILDRRWEKFFDKKNVYIRSIYLKGLFFCKKKTYSSKYQKRDICFKKKITIFGAKIR